MRDQFFNVGDGNFTRRQLQREVVELTESGTVVEDEAHLREVLHNLILEFQQNGCIACNSVGVEKYSRKIQVEKLAQLIHQIADKKN